MIPRPDMPFSVNEGNPLPGNCAWLLAPEMPAVVHRLRSWSSAIRDGGRASVRVMEFIERLPSFVGARAEFLAAAPANNIRFVMGYEIPERYAALMAARRATGRDEFEAHFRASVVGCVATPTVGAAAAGVESAAAIAGTPQ